MLDIVARQIHNMGGNDGMKGDMRMLEDLPALALAAGASIIGTGATPEGIDQNPVYYEYLYDTAWHASPQPLGTWFQQYAARRYGMRSGDAGAEAATAAWKLLGSTVYQTQAGGWSAAHSQPVAASEPVMLGHARAHG